MSAVDGHRTGKDHRTPAHASLRSRALNTVGRADVGGCGGSPGCDARLGQHAQPTRPVRPRCEGSGGVPEPIVAVENSASVWVLACAALVFLMIPGIALFYGGMVRRGNVLSVLVQAFAGMAVITLTWVLLGFSLAFGGQGSVLGGLAYLGIPAGANNSTLPVVSVPAFALFHLMLAIVAGVLILGAGAERWRFS